jgi:hypothetical protein
MNHMTRNIVRLERQPPQNPKSTWGGLLAGVFFTLSPDGGEDVGSRTVWRLRYTC